MGRDGMLPEIFHRLNPSTFVPVRNTLIVALFVGLLAGFVPLGVLIDLTSMGTLVAFTVVSIGVIILRRTQPDLPRGFRRSEEHTSELQSRQYLVCRLLLEKKKKQIIHHNTLSSQILQ